MKPPPPFYLLHGPVTWQTFRDDQEADVIPEVLHGTWDEMYDELQEKNQGGAGIYYTVNETDGTGRKAENITDIRAWYTDIDGIPEGPRKRGVIRRLLEHATPPSAIVETRNGIHAIWYAIPGEPVEKEAYRKVEEGLITYWGGDNTVKDLSRVLRAPHFVHQKRKAGEPKPEPFTIRLVHEDTFALYEAEELLRCFPAPVRHYRKDYDRTLVVSAEGDWGKVVEALAAWPGVPQARHKVMTIACGVALKFGIGESQCVSDLAPIVTSWPTGRDMHAELIRTARWAFEQNDPATVKALRNEGVDVPRLTKPD